MGEMNLIARYLVDRVLLFRISSDDHSQEKGLPKKGESIFEGTCQK